MAESKHFSADEKAIKIHEFEQARATGMSKLAAAKQIGLSVVTIKRWIESPKRKKQKELSSAREPKMVTIQTENAKKPPVMVVMGDPESVMQVLHKAFGYLN